MPKEMVRETVFGDVADAKRDSGSGNGEADI